MKRLRHWLEQPTSAASLGVFRLCFGLVQVWQTWEFIRPVGGISTLTYLYTGPDVAWNFPYPGFEWVRPLPEPFTSIAFGVLMLSSIMLVVGLCSRSAAFVNGVLFTLAWMMEACWWNNHFYLTSIVAIVLALSPCGAAFSIDRWRDRTQGTVDRLWNASIPFWPVFLLRAQLYIVYTYAAVVKMNPDWLMGEPIRMWFRNELAGKPLAQVLSPEAMQTVYGVLGSEIAVAMFTWGGLVFDLTVGLMLCFRRTQLLAIVLMFLFHSTNYWVFMIGAFPFMAFTSTLIFLAPDWPIQLGRWLARRSIPAPDPGWMLTGMIIVPLIGSVLGWKLPAARSTGTGPMLARLPTWGVVGIFLWIAIQALLPLRHLTIPGNVHWTLEGSRFSWQVMARSHSSHTLYKIHLPAWDQDAEAHRPVAWPRIEGGPPACEYRHIDAARVDPRACPEVVIVSEPWVRERIFLRPAAKPESLDQSVQRARDLWQQHFGRFPTAAALGRPLPGLMRELRERIAKVAKVEDPRYAQAVFACERLAQHATALGELSPDDPSSLEKCLDVQNMLTMLRTMLQPLGLEGELFRVLVQTHPFEIQTGRGQPWVQIVDINLMDDDQVPEDREGDRQRILWANWKFEKIVHIDLLRTQSQLMTLYPRQMFGYDQGGRPTVFWNAIRDLVSIQREIHGSSGLMIHQYANGRIARFWQENTGVRPQVHVDAFCRLNQHPLQPLIDPNVDLASAPLTIWTHNPWILDQEYRTIVYHDRGHPQMRTIHLPPATRQP